MIVMGSGWFFTREKASLDILWLREENVAKTDNVSVPDILAQEIVDDLETGLEQFREIATELGTTEKKST